MYAPKENDLQSLQDAHASIGNQVGVITCGSIIQSLLAFPVSFAKYQTLTLTLDSFSFFVLFLPYQVTQWLSQYKSFVQRKHAKSRDSL
jgi:hypothetical protein